MPIAIDQLLPNLCIIFWFYDLTTFMGIVTIKHAPSVADVFSLTNKLQYKIPCSVLKLGIKNGISYNESQT